MGIEALWEFLKHPLYREDPDRSLRHRLRQTAVLLAWALGIGILLAMILGVVGMTGPWDLDEHAFEALLEEFPPWQVFLLGALVAPLLEELLFRGPLWFFRNSRHFGTAFYIAAVAFALVHLSNFPNLSEIWYLSPLLISPQLSLGAFLGFIRVRFGLLWAMLFHAVYNGILLGPLLLWTSLGLPTS